MNLLKRLIVIISIGALTWSSYAQVECSNFHSLSSPPIVLIESSAALNSMKSLQVHSMDWSQKMESQETIASDSFIYTSAVMNFLEIASLADSLNTTQDSSPNMMTTRLGLFFVQLKQSQRLAKIWVDLVKEITPKEEQENFLEFSTSSIALEKYIKQMAHILMLSGQRLHEISKYEIDIPFFSITTIAMSPRTQNILWQNLLFHLVQWQFSMSLEYLEKVYCQAVSNNQDQLVIKIPRTPLLDFYVIEFELWGRTAGTLVQLKL